MVPMQNPRPVKWTPVAPARAPVQAASFAKGSERMSFTEHVVH